MSVINRFMRTHPLLCADDSFAKFAFSWSINLWFKNKQIIKSVFIGLFLTYRVVPAAQGQDTSEGSTFYDEFVKQFIRLATGRGPVLVLSEHIPCACLNWSAETVKQALSSTRGVCIKCVKKLPLSSFQTTAVSSVGQSIGKRMYRSMVSCFAIHDSISNLSIYGCSDRQE